MSVASFCEVSIVIECEYGAEGLRDLDRFISRARIELVAVDPEQGQVARSAFSRFCKGPHRSGLNYRDCFPMRPRSAGASPCSARAMISSTPTCSSSGFSMGDRLSIGAADVDICCKP
jgi:hypothetical protein